MKKAIIGIVDSQAQAERIVSMLQANAFDAHDVSILLPDTKGPRDFGHEPHTKAPEGAIAGASTGGVLGGALGLLAGIGTLAIPGLGAFIAAGPMLSALSGAAAGATLGGITGALVGMGIPEIEAKTYEGKIRGGNILIAVHTETSDQQKKASEVLRRLGARDVSRANEAAVERR